MQSFLEFTKTGNLSGARIIGYKDNKEISFSFDSLASAVYSYILQKSIEPPVMYRFDPETHATISNPNITNGFYLSSSVQQLDLYFNNAWMTLTKTGSCYDIEVDSSTLSANNTKLCPGGWIYIKNTALSSTKTLYFQQTGSAVITLEPTTVIGEEPKGLYPNKIQSLLRDIQLNILIRSLNWAAEKLKDQICDGAAAIIPATPSNISPSSACEKYRIKWLSFCTDATAAYNSLFNHTGFEDWMQKHSILHDLHTAFIKALFNTNTNPCGGVVPLITMQEAMNLSDSAMQEYRDLVNQWLNQRDDLTK